MGMASITLFLVFEVAVSLLGKTRTTVVGFHSFHQRDKSHSLIPNPKILAMAHCADDNRTYPKVPRTSRGQSSAHREDNTAGWSAFIQSNETALKHELNTQAAVFGDQFRKNFLQPLIEGEVTTSKMAIAILDDLAKEKAGTQTSQMGPTPIEVSQQPEYLEPRAFIEKFFESMPKEWEWGDPVISINLVFKFNGDDDFVGQLFFSSRRRTRERMQEDITSWLDEQTQADQDTSFVYMRFDRGREGQTFYGEDALRMDTIQGYFQPEFGALLNALKATSQPLDYLKRHSSLTSPELEFVSVSPKKETADQYFSMLPNQKSDEKAYAVVVAGESGSGKSVYSCLQAEKSGFIPLYMVVTAKVLQSKPEDPKLHPRPYLCELLDLVIDELCKTQGHDDALDLLRDEQVNLHEERNEWARAVLDDLIKATVGNLEHNKLKSWTKKNWLLGRCRPEQRPKKLALILDEATDLDLVNGLVASVRVVTSKYRKLMAQEDLLLILTGTGLDLIRSDERVGTDPGKARLVTMRHPELQELRNRGVIDNVLHDAILDGTYSRTLMTNARMLFRSVLPVLSWEIHKTDGPNFDADELKQRRLGRLVDVASFGAIMDYGPRLYISTNSLQHLEEHDLSGLFERAFLFHLKSALEFQKEEMHSFTDDVKTNLAAVKSDVDSWISHNQKEVSEVFQRGLATKSQETSTALKYLACFGLTCQLRPGFGDSFEELTAMHCLRLAEIRGYSTKRHCLEFAWPSKYSKKKDIDEEEIENLKYELENQKALEQEKLVFPSLDKFCMVFSQGTPTAQGPDVLVLYIDGNEAFVDFVQCKNHKNSPGPETVKKWWNSLGIDMNDESGQCLEPSDAGSSLYSYTGMLAFCSMIQGKLEETKKNISTVSIRQRVLAVSFRCPTNSSNFPIPSSELSRVWFREMMEPTISVLSPHGKD